MLGLGLGYTFSATVTAAYNAHSADVVYILQLPPLGKGFSARSAGNLLTILMIF